MYQESKDLCNEISSLRSDLKLKGYPRGFIDSVINSKGSSSSSKEQERLDSVYIPYLNGVSENLKRIGNKFG
jgi:hypothetical protein